VAWVEVLRNPGHQSGCQNREHLLAIFPVFREPFSADCVNGTGKSIWNNPFSLLPGFKTQGESKKDFGFSLVSRAQGDKKRRFQIMLEDFFLNQDWNPDSLPGFFQVTLMISGSIREEHT
jgi:hypothetical protein